MEFGCQVRASWTIQSSRSPGGLHGMRYPFLTWTSEWAWQTCPIVLTATVVWKKTAEHAFYNCKRVWPFWDHVGEWMACAARCWLCHRQHSASVYGWEVSGASRDPSCSKNGDLDDARRRDCLTMKRWWNAASLVVRKGAMLGSFFPPLPAHNICGPGPSGPHLESVDFAFPWISS